MTYTHPQQDFDASGEAWEAMPLSTMSLIRVFMWDMKKYTTRFPTNKEDISIITLLIS